MKKILITGAAGFLGVNLALRLLEDENNFVYGIDNFSSSDVSNLYRLLKNNRFSFIEQDISDRISLYADEIYNLAGFGDKKVYFDNKFDCSCQILNSTKNILNFASSCGAKVVFITENIEKYNSNSNYNVYCCTEVLKNDLILEYSKIYNLNSKIIRLYNVYGAYFTRNDMRFIPSGINKAFNNEDIIIEEDFSDYYTYSNDVIIGLIKVMNSYLDKQLIDISYPNWSLKSDIAKLIINFTKSKSNLIIKNDVLTEPNYKPDISYLNNELDFGCNTSLLDGISKTIDYIKLAFYT